MTKKKTTTKAKAAEVKESKEEVKETKKVETKKPAPKKRPKRVVVDRETEVIFMNNTNGGLFYRCPKTHAVYDMQEYGDEDYITVEQLLIMNNTSRKMLKELWVLLVDTADEDVEIEDVIKYLGLDSLYNDEVAPENIDDFIIKSTDNRFEKSLSKMGKTLGQKIVERSILLFREGSLNSFSKMSILKEFTDNEDLFE